MSAYKAGELPEDALLRALVAWPSWFMPVDEHRRAVLWTIDERAWVAGMTERTSPDGEARQFLEMRGRHLVRNLPEDAQGLTFDLGRDNAVAVPREAFGALVEMANALDLDDALDHPAPGQERRFLEHAWLVLSRDGRPAVDGFRGLETVRIFTAQDEVRRYVEREPQHKGLDLRKVPGQTLFTHLAGRDDWDAVWIDAHREHVPGGDAHIREAYGPSMAADLAAGREFRAEARILPARTIAEIHLFLDQVGMVERREHALVSARDATGAEVLAARYEGAVLGSARREYLFEPVVPTADPRDLGEGASQVLCAGKLADVLRRRLDLLPADPAQVPPNEREFAAVAARWAFELLKLLEGPTIPRHAIRSPDGARFVRERPAIVTRAWLARAYRLAGDISRRN